MQIISEDIQVFKEKYMQSSKDKCLHKLKPYYYESGNVNFKQMIMQEYLHI